MAGSIRWALWLVFAFGAVGCGSPAFDVTGTVTYNGAALDKPDGQIVFLGPHGEQIAAPIDPDGTYRARGVPSGANRVAVYYPNPKAKMDKASKLKPGEMPRAIPKYLTPEKYASAETSDLAVTVEKPTVYTAELTGPKIP